LDKDYWSSIKNCTVYRGSQSDIGFNPARPDTDPVQRCDHELLTLDIEIDRTPPSSSHHSLHKQPHISFLTSKLKDEATLEKFQNKLEELSTTTLTAMEASHLQYQNGHLDQKTYINQLSHLFTKTLQTARHEILKNPSPTFPDPNKPRPRVFTCDLATEIACLWGVGGEGFLF
jgi:hypothetical protein